MKPVISKIFGFCALLLLPSVSLYAASSKITQLSLEELMNTEVTSASRKAEPLNRTPAAIYVITQEDIRRSGYTKVPELLRMVPGLQVARVTANQWAISSRGFNGLLSNKLLVMIDGRTVYTPLYSGVYWDVQDLVLSNIERIEVIRGPGGSVWGSNAVNGVINIITKQAKDTQGTYLEGYGGSEEQGGSGRYGGKIGENIHYRGSAKYFNRDSSFHGNDAYHIGRAGARVDWQADENDSVTVQGDYYNGERDIRVSEVMQEAPFTRTLLGDSSLGGGDILARWNHIYSETSDSSLQIYFDQARRFDPHFKEDRYTGDIDWQHRFFIGDRNEIVWGLNSRVFGDNTKGTFGAYFDPSRRIDTQHQAFLQDTITLYENHLWLTLGTKFEINEYSGFEYQPTARILWQPKERHSFWAAVSRAVRTPSRFDHDVVISGWFAPGTALGRADGDSGRPSETLIAYEAGYRVQPHDKVSLDFAAFLNKYENLSTFTPYDTFTENGYTVQRFLIGDDAQAYSVGGEASAKVQAHENLLIDFGYSFLQLYVHSTNDFTYSAKAAEGQSPEHQIFVRPRLDLPGNVEFDAQIRYVDALKNLNVRAYWEMDLRLAWRATENVEFSVVGQNLLHNRHIEFPSNRPEPAETERTVYGKVTVEI